MIWKTTGRKYRYELQTAFCNLQNAVVKYSINDDDDEEAEEHDDDSDATLAGCKIQLRGFQTHQTCGEVYCMQPINTYILNDYEQLQVWVPEGLQRCI